MKVVSDNSSKSPQKLPADGKSLKKCSNNITMKKLKNLLRDQENKWEARFKLLECELEELKNEVRQNQVKSEQQVSSRMSTKRFGHFPSVLADKQAKTKYEELKAMSIKRAVEIEKKNKEKSSEEKRKMQIEELRNEERKKRKEEKVETIFNQSLFFDYDK